MRRSLLLLTTTVLLTGLLGCTGADQPSVSPTTSGPTSAPSPTPTPTPTPTWTNIDPQIIVDYIPDQPLASGTFDIPEGRGMLDVQILDLVRDGKVVRLRALFTPHLTDVGVGETAILSSFIEDSNQYWLPQLIDEQNLVAYGLSQGDPPNHWLLADSGIAATNGQPILAWAGMAAPPADVTHVNVRVNTWTPDFENLPITDVSQPGTPPTPPAADPTNQPTRSPSAPPSGEDGSLDIGVDDPSPDQAIARATFASPDGSGTVEAGILSLTRRGDVLLLRVFVIPHLDDRRDTVYFQEAIGTSSFFWDPWIYDLADYQGYSKLRIGERWVSEGNAEAPNHEPIYAWAAFPAPLSDADRVTVQFTSWMPQFRNVPITEDVLPATPVNHADHMDINNLPEITPDTLNRSTWEWNAKRSVTSLGTATEEGSDSVIRLSSDVLFRFDSATLPAAAGKQIAQLLDEVPNGAKLRIAGHTDSVGSTAYNKKLSQARAEAVATVVAQVRPDLRLTVKWYGESDPIASNSDPEGRAKNRRVELRYKAG